MSEGWMNRSGNGAVLAKAIELAASTIMSESCTCRTFKNTFKHHMAYSIHDTHTYVTYIITLCIDVHIYMHYVFWELVDMRVVNFRYGLVHKTFF